MIDLSDTAFVSIDIQPRERIVWTEENILDVYVRSGFTLEELNEAVRHFHKVALPNAVKVARLARAAGMPRVFVHWAAEKCGGTPIRTQPRPHDDFDVRDDDIVIAKTEMDAFVSSTIESALAGLGRGTLLMVGGHSKGCLGETAKSAIARGYRCVLVRDASYDCSIIRWPKGIAEVPYHRILSTADIAGPS